MKIVHFATSDLIGGAAKAGYRLHEALKYAGSDSRMVVARKASDDSHVVSAAGNGLGAWIRLGVVDAGRYAIGHRLCRAKAAFDVDFIGLRGGRLASFLQNAQVVHLHWVSGFLTSGGIKRMWQSAEVPIVWTLMDLAPLTGGCHYTGDCRGYTRRCGACPQIQSNTQGDISRWNWHIKSKNLKSLPITIVAPTRWVAERAKQSSLFQRNQVVMIPLALNAEIFRPLEQRLAREVLRLPLDKKLIFFGADSISEERKGFHYLAEALQHLEAKLTDDCALPTHQVAIAVAGRINPSVDYRYPFESHHLGLLNDDRALALAYQAADVFVCPSVEDAGPMMINEALLCGTPVVAFNAGGAPDFVESFRTGYLATLRDSRDLAEGIAY